jgi:hypothetical protein
MLTAENARAMAAKSNTPHIDLATALEPDKLKVYIDYEYANHETRITELMAAHDRFLAATPQGIHDDAIAGRAADFANQLRAAATDLDATRAKIKAPVLHAQRLIDGEARRLTDRLTTARTSVSDKLTVYLQAKEAAERQCAAEEAARKELEAFEAIKAAEQTGDTAPAVEALKEADAAIGRASAPTVELTRTRSQMGSLTSLRETWTYETTDISKVPAAYLTVNDAVVKAAIKSGARDIPGLRIFAERKAMVR